jgi:hypothetical protein
MTKNLVILTKLTPTAPFSFEENEANPLEISTKVEFIEYRSYQHNIQQVPGLNMHRLGGGHRFGSVSHDGNRFLIFRL